MARPMSQNLVGVAREQPPTSRSSDQNSSGDFEEAKSIKLEVLGTGHPTLGEYWLKDLGNGDGHRLRNESTVDVLEV